MAITYGSIGHSAFDTRNDRLHAERRATEIAPAEEQAEPPKAEEPEEAEEPEVVEEPAEPEPEVEEPTEEPEPEPEGPVVMRVGTTGIWNGNNLGVEVSGWLAYRLIFNSIIELGPKGASIPGLAESWSVDESGLVWT